MKRRGPEAAPSSASEAELAKKWGRLVPAIADSEMRGAFVEQELLSLDVPVASRVLDDLAARAEQADSSAREVLAAVLPLLYAPARQGFVEALREVARDEALLALSRLLRRKPKAPGIEERRTQERPGFALEPGGRPLTLGERRALARKPSRPILDKLLADPHPLVIKNLLGNPRLTEDDVIRMATKRPARAEVILEIARCPKWMCRPRVRMALVLNPGTPTEVSVPVLSQLLRPELQEVAEATFVPKVLRSAALELLERRPPAPEKAGGGTVQ